MAGGPQLDIGKNFLTVKCQELWFTGSKGGFWDMPILGVFFSLKQETVWVVFCSPVDGLDGFLSLESTSLMLLRGVSYTAAFTVSLPAADSQLRRCGVFPTERNN